MKASSKPPAKAGTHMSTVAGIKTGVESRDIAGVISGIEVGIKAGTKMLRNVDTMTSLIPR